MEPLVGGALCLATNLCVPPSLSFLLLPLHHALPASDLLEPTCHLTMSTPISDPLEPQAQKNSFFPELLSAVAFTAATEKQLMANKGN